MIEKNVIFYINAVVMHTVVLHVISTYKDLDNV